MLDPEDFEQQAWAYFLEGLPPVPAGVDAAVWEVGRLAGKLHAWCRGLYRRASREVLWPEDLDVGDTVPDPQAWLDVVAEAERVCTDEELACVYFRFAGYRGEQAQEILGITEAAYRQRLHRLRERLSNG